MSEIGREREIPYESGGWFRAGRRSSLHHHDRPENDGPTLVDLSMKLEPG